MSIVLRNEADAKFPYRFTDGLDHKAWAKRILYREERGDKSLLPIQVKFAREAMNVQQEVV